MSTVNGGPGNIVTNGLVLYLDAANRTSYVSGSTVWNDLSSGRNNGTLVNGPTFSGANGGSIVFDGVNDYVSLPTPSLLTYSNSFTISCWVKLNGINKPLFQNIFGRASGGSINDIWQILAISSANTLFYRSRINPTTTSDISGVTTLTTGSIYNFTVTINNSTGSLYINSTVDNTTTSLTLISTGSILGISIGRFPDSNTQFLDSNIYNLSYYNRALSQSEITQNYNSTRARFGL